jgi:DNA-binding NarL/FixJ family response regulator
MLRILIADDHTAVRERLKRIVGDQGDMEVAGEAASAQELLDLVRSMPCDAVVLDISLPGKGVPAVLVDLNHERPGLPVLVVSMHFEHQDALRALILGPARFLTKLSLPEVVVRAIREAVAGDR